MNIDFALTIDNNQVDGLIDIDGVIIEYHDAPRDSFTPFLASDMPGIDVEPVLAAYRDIARHAFTLPPAVSLDESGFYTARHDYYYHGVRSVTRYEHYRLIDVLPTLTIPPTPDTIQQRLDTGTWTYGEVVATLHGMAEHPMDALLFIVHPAEWPKLDWANLTDTALSMVIPHWLDTDPQATVKVILAESACYQRCVDLIDVAGHPAFPVTTRQYEEVPLLMTAILP